MWDSTGLKVFKMQPVPKTQATLIVYRNAIQKQEMPAYGDTRAYL